MVYYKSLRIIDENPRWVIEDEDGNINKNPTKEQLKLAILEDVPRICSKCRNRNTYVIPNNRRLIISADGIYKYIDPSRGSKWKEFRIDENIYNDAYQFIISNLEYCPVFKNKNGGNI